MEPLFSIYTHSPRRRVTVAAFFTRESAERQLEAWRERERRGGRLDVRTDDLFVDEVDACSAEGCPLCAAVAPRRCATHGWIGNA